MGPSSSFHQVAKKHKKGKKHGKKHGKKAC